MRHVIGLALHQDAMLYETAIAAEIFGVDRSDLSSTGAWYELLVCTPDGSSSPWLPGSPARGFAELAGVDTVVVPSTSAPGRPPDPALCAALRAAHDAGARIAALCTGSFVLAAAGLLDGRSAATHWMHAEQLARLHPAVNVRADVLYVDEGQVLTSAGKTAALDLCLHLVHRDHGLSTRQLARRMRAETGLSPLGWLHQQRITRAQDLLERTDATIEQVAARCGMGTATTLRRHFRQAVGVSPTTYRTAFRN